MKKPKLIHKYLLITLMVFTLSSVTFPAQAAGQKAGEGCSYPTFTEVQAISANVTNTNRFFGISALYEWLFDTCRSNDLYRFFNDSYGMLLQPNSPPPEYVKNKDNCLFDNSSVPIEIPVQTIDEDARPLHQSTENEVSPPVLSVENYADEVFRLINIERAYAGLSPLIKDDALTQAAKIRCVEIITDFSHIRPEGNSCFTALQEAGASYSKAGGNIAIGQNNPDQVVAAWMDSPGHRANIMDPGFSRIGVAVRPAGGAYGGYAWTQFFAD